MLQTKDFFLFILTLLFLLLAIAVTLQPSRSSGLLADAVSFSDPSESYVAVNADPGIDRNSIVDRLRSQISDSDLIWRQPEIPDSGSLTDSVAAVVSTSTDADITCVDYTDDILAAVTWPQDALVREQGGLIEVYVNESVVGTTTQVVGTTTTIVATTTVVTEVVWSKLKQLQAGESQCAASTYIGVAVDGTLLRNDAVAAYATTPTDTLIGYARDGVPIYGVYTGEVDACNGYQHPSGYRYVLTPFSTEFIGCFSNPPQPL